MLNPILQAVQGRDQESIPVQTVCEENYETAHFTAQIAQTMEVGFAGKTFELIDRLTGEVSPIIVVVAVLPYSQYIYAEGMASTKEMQ